MTIIEELADQSLVLLPILRTKTLPFIEVFHKQRHEFTPPLIPHNEYTSSVNILNRIDGLLLVGRCEPFVGGGAYSQYG